MDPRYSPQVLEHFRSPRHAGRLSRRDPDVGTGEARADSGERVQLQIRVSADGRVAAARFRAFGCPITIACASRAAERICASDLGSAQRLGPAELVADLALAADQAELAELVIRALQAALADLHTKRRV